MALVTLILAACSSPTATPVDMDGPADLARVVKAADLSTEPDLRAEPATVDMSLPPDIARPDLSTVDLSTLPDLATPDLARPDLAYCSPHGDSCNTFTGGVGSVPCCAGLFCQQQGTDEGICCTGNLANCN